MYIELPLLSLSSGSLSVKSYQISENLLPQILRHPSQNQDNFDDDHTDIFNLMVR